MFPFRNAPSTERATSSHPYRDAGARASNQVENSFEAALVVAQMFLVLWSFLRVVVGASCARIDGESLAALAIAAFLAPGLAARMKHLLFRRSR